MTAATGWQAHSARCALPGALGKTLGRVVTSPMNAQGRAYRINQPAP
ncbi:DUF3489 domain-containing protein [Pseudotabrizicola sp. 4114]